MSATGFSVRFKGHLCAAVKTGFARKPILFRVREGEEPFVADVAEQHVVLAARAPYNDILEDPTAAAEQLARLECARAIKRTEFAYRKLAAGGDHMLRGVKSVERLIQLVGGNGPTPGFRRGKRWKIVPHEVKKGPDNKSCGPDNNPAT